MQFVAIMIVVLGVLSPTRRDQESAPRPADPLQGEWTLLETADQHRRDRGDEQIRMLLRGHEVTLMFGELRTNHGTFVLGASNVLKTIDFKLANGRTVLGIYEIERGVLTICADDAANGRPVTLAPQGKQWVEKWKPSRR